MKIASLRYLSLLVLVVLLLAGCTSPKEASDNKGSGNLLESNHENHGQVATEAVETGEDPEDESLNQGELDLGGEDNQIYDRGKMKMRAPGCKLEVRKMKRED